MTQKTKNSILLKAATALPTSYGAGWVSNEFPTVGLDELKLLFEVSGAFDGTSIEIKTQVVDDTPGEDKSYTELQPTGVLDDATVAAAILTSESNLISYSLGCQQYDRVKVYAKRTGGTQGDLALRVLGG